MFGGRSARQRAQNRATPGFSPGARRPDNDQRMNARGNVAHQAARTEVSNLETSALRRPLSPDSDFAADSTCEDAEPVSVAPRSTSVMLDDTCWVPRAACW